MEDAPCVGPLDGCCEVESQEQIPPSCAATLNCHVQDFAESCTNQEVFTISLFAWRCLTRYQN